MLGIFIACLCVLDSGVIETSFGFCTPWPPNSSVLTVLLLGLPKIFFWLVLLLFDLAEKSPLLSSAV